MRLEFSTQTVGLFLLRVFLFFFLSELIISHKLSHNDNPIEKTTKSKHQIK